MRQLAPVVFLLDVDNTLLDNDRIIADLKNHLTQAFGAGPSSVQERNLRGLHWNPRIEARGQEEMATLCRGRCGSPDRCPRTG
jgi:beta-phosphoglucomutase-like phosphatase (HAD superfamily)